MTEIFIDTMMLLSAEMLAGFVLASLVVLIIPGPGVLYIIARSIAQGRRAGLVSVAGLACGAAFHENSHLNCVTPRSIKLISTDKRF